MPALYEVFQLVLMLRSVHRAVQRVLLSLKPITAYMRTPIRRYKSPFYLSSLN
jgi:hypothetical protein